MTKIFTFFKYPNNLTDAKPDTLKLMYLQNICTLRGLSFSSEGEGGGSQIYKKSESIKLRPPDYGNKIFMAPITVTPYHLNMLKLF